MMDIKKIIILVNGKDKTSEIATIRRDVVQRKIEVVYLTGTKVYPYNQNRVKILENPKIIELKGRVAYIDNLPVYEPKIILDFGEKIRIIQDNGSTHTIKPERFSLVDNGATNQNAQQMLAYLRDIAQYTVDKPEEEAFLKQEMEQLTFVHPESVLSHYLLRWPVKTRTPDMDGVIFPFPFNLSQKAALENAVTNSISVVEGPPGTGKTQTILNILANLIAVQGKSVAVVSNNNEAVKNVIEKMGKQGYGFLTALLGKKDNQDAFFANMPTTKIDGWDNEGEKGALFQHVKNLNIQLNELLTKDRKRAQLRQELRAWQLEQEHFEEYFSRQDIEEISKLPLFWKTPDRIISFLAETSLAKEKNRTNKLFYKLKLLFKYGVFDYKSLEMHEASILLSLQKEFYRQQIKMLGQEISTIEGQLQNASFDKLLKEHQQYSEKLFRKCLYQSHSVQPEPDFTKKNFKIRFDDFIKAYPIILSTTHSLRRSIPQNYLLDYVIIDEASQVDLITGVLAFSCCRNVIIVGDIKQLPQITNKAIEAKLATTPPCDIYNYFQHNILSSTISLYGKSLPCETLQEHYRCHPQIIEFCNQKYYDGQLIPYTDPSLSECPLVLYKTSEGNHMRQVTRGAGKGRYNQRELDVIVEEILKAPDLVERREGIGFVTPYRKQANKATQLLTGGIESDTVHKYQGREKNVMIMSTVLDSSWGGQQGIDFVDDPQMVNVAVSRAIEQFILVTDHDLFFKKGKNISDLIRYIEYSTLDENIIDSQVVSVFDLLYRKYSSKLIPLKAKMDPEVRYQSEEALRVLLEEILQKPQYAAYSYAHGMLLRNLLNTVELLSPEELSFISNRASLDFVIFRKLDKSCVLVVEVDGFAFHENNPDQQHRDALKDAILKKHNVPLLRLATNGSREREKIERALQESFHQ